ncbi:MAG: hypothetical protein JWM11_2772 [Planctomycetaceae bacterium]|nr:hypothetical protein [Planctomycetaceae bacterium]
MTSSHESEQPRVSLGFSPFTAAEMESFQNNDSMAAGMIATILGLAFLVLLGLVITVSVWTLNSTV